MSISRVKTIAIVVLLLINAFFAAVIMVDTVDDARIERQSIEYACDMIRSYGIAIDSGDVITKSAIRTMRTARESEAEALIAQALLGDNVMIDLGVIFLYENDERGTAEFYSAGDFEVRLNPGVITNEKGTMRTVQELLSDMGLETASHVFSLSEESEKVTVIEAYKGASIFNCATEFIFSGGSLNTIIGRYVTGVEPVEDSTEIMQAGTALLSFLAWVRRGNAGCTQILRAEAGYQHRELGSFGEGVIAPAWLILTDSGKYIIDDATGDIWPAS